LCPRIHSSRKRREKIKTRGGGGRGKKINKKLGRKGVGGKLFFHVTTFSFSLKLLRNQVAISRKSERQSSTQQPANLFILTPFPKVDIETET